MAKIASGKPKVGGAWLAFWIIIKLSLCLVGQTKFSKKIDCISKAGVRKRKLGENL